MSLSPREIAVGLFATRVGYVCRVMRIKRGMTAGELAEKIGCTVRKIEKLEHGEGQRFNIGFLGEIAWALDFEWDLSARDATYEYAASGVKTIGGEEADNA